MAGFYAAATAYDWVAPRLLPFFSEDEIFFLAIGLLEPWVLLGSLRALRYGVKLLAVSAYKSSVYCVFLIRWWCHVWLVP